MGSLAHTLVLFAMGRPLFYMQPDRTIAWQVLAYHISSLETVELKPQVRLPEGCGAGSGEPQRLREEQRQLEEALCPRILRKGWAGCYWVEGRDGSPRDSFQGVVNFLVKKLVQMDGGLWGR